MLPTYSNTSQIDGTLLQAAEWRRIIIILCHCHLLHVVRRKPHLHSATEIPSPPASKINITSLDKVRNVLPESYGQPHRVVMISVSVSLSQMPAYTVRQEIWNECIT